jgi:hypothetical protein
MAVPALSGIPCQFWMMWSDDDEVIDVVEVDVMRHLEVLESILQHSWIGIFASL